jgi:hypothetical protein
LGADFTALFSQLSGKAAMKKQRVTAKSPTEKRGRRPRIRRKLALSPLMQEWRAASRSARDQLLRYIFGELVGSAVIAMRRARAQVEPARSRLAAETHSPPHPVDEFLTTCVRQRAGAEVNAEHLHRLFCSFAAKRQLPSLSIVRFSRELQARGFQRRRSSVVYWVGLQPKISEVERS